MKPLLVLAAFPMVLMGWASCSHSGTGHAALPEFKNPFHPSTYAHFVARKDYRKTYDVYKDDTLLNRQPKKSRKIFVCLDEQRGQYLVDGLVAMDFPLSSGRPKRGTTPLSPKRKTILPTSTAKCMMPKANASTTMPNPRIPYRREVVLTALPCLIGSVLPTRGWACM